MRKIVKASVLFALILAVSSYSSPAETVIAQNDEVYTVQLGGEAFGIKMFSDGVLVVEIEDSIYGSDIPSPASEAGIKVNDIIKSVNGKSVTSNEQLTEFIKSAHKTSLELVIDRDGSEIATTLTPQYDSQGTLRAGMWIKDSAAGIGTVTYYDTNTNTFGALGHGVCESQTGSLIPLSHGEVTGACITDVTKSENGQVGSLNGYFEDTTIGGAKLNTDCGLFGEFEEDAANKEYIEVASKDEVNVGDATIYCTVDGNEVKEYDIKIKRLQRKNSDEGMIIEITDPELLNITGGIVQGMSGSPIVQNGKLIGAVTHVLVNNVKCGYGIYIEEMLSESNK